MRMCARPTLLTPLALSAVAQANSTTDSCNFASNLVDWLHFQSSFSTNAADGTLLEALMEAGRGLLAYSTRHSMTELAGEASGRD